MRIKKIKLVQFRNYEELDLEVNPQVNLLVGLNGQGKSNFLESIQLALTGESFRPTQTTDFVNHTALSSQSLIRLELQARDVEKIVESRLTRLKREATINGKKASRQALQKHFSTVVFSPESLMVVKQGPQERRHFLDSLLVSLYREEAPIVFDYTRCVKSKNKVLKDHIEGEIATPEAKILLDSLNTLFLPLATKLVAKRLKVVREILPRVKGILADILKKELVDISVEYVISGQSAIDWSENQVYDALKSRLKELSATEISSGQSLVGPHKHDVRFKFNGQDARYFCSQGQQRAIALAFKIAHILVHFENYGDYPVLLLDDVFSELDKEKREVLLRILSDLPAQIFLSTAEIEPESLFGYKDANIFLIEKGNVKTGWN